MAQQGWYPDPSGQQQLRYFDGQVWTDHVSVGGVMSRQPLPPPGAAPFTQPPQHQPGPNQSASFPPGPFPAGPHQAGQYQAGPYQPGPYQAGQYQPGMYQPVAAAPSGNGMAVAALATGVSGAVLGLLPIAFFLAIILGVLAIIFGAVGMGAARKGAPRRGLAVSGLIVGIVAVALGAWGLYRLVNAVEDFANDIDTIFEDVFEPVDSADFDLTIDRCERTAGGDLVASGEITNTSPRSLTYGISIDFLADGEPTASAFAFTITTLVDPGETVNWDVTTVAVDQETVRCKPTVT